MTDITQAQLEEVVTYYVNANDKPTAINYIKSWGPRIPGYNINEAIGKVLTPKTVSTANTIATPETPVNKPTNTVTPQNESKPVETGTPSQTTTQPAESTTPPVNNVK
jgi:hypothetical protein